MGLSICAWERMAETLRIGDHLPQNVLNLLSISILPHYENQFTGGWISGRDFLNYDGRPSLHGCDPDRMVRLIPHSPHPPQRGEDSMRLMERVDGLSGMGSLGPLSNFAALRHTDIEVRVHGVQFFHK
jgi:hypothetical protein